MTLEDVICGRMVSDRALSGLLAEYDGGPAVFYQTAPDDTAAGWKHRTQYPRISYHTDYISDPERKTAGTLILDIICTETGVMPEEIEPVIRRLLSGVFFTPDGAAPCSLSWARSDVFDITKSDGMIIGITMTFDLYAFPSQITTDPDPVLALDRYIKALIPEAVMIAGKPPIDRIFEPSRKFPAFYCRAERLSISRQTNTVAWLDGTVVCHIFAGGEETTWLRYLVNNLALDSEIIMLDTSPMFIQNLTADNTLSALSTGQLRLNVRYGLLRRQEYSHPLINSNFGCNKPVCYKDLWLTDEEGNLLFDECGKILSAINESKYMRLLPR